MLGNVGGNVAFSSGFGSSIVFARNIAYPDEQPISVEIQVAISLAALAVWSIMCLARTDIIGWISNFAVFWQLCGSVVIVASLLILAPAHATADSVFLHGIDRTNFTQSEEIPYLGMPVSAYAVVLGITNCLFAFTGLLH
jgi:amino acid transporter